MESSSAAPVAVPESQPSRPFESSAVPPAALRELTNQVNDAAPSKRPRVADAPARPEIVEVSEERLDSDRVGHKRGRDGRPVQLEPAADMPLP